MEEAGVGASIGLAIHATAWEENGPGQEDDLGTLCRLGLVTRRAILELDDVLGIRVVLGRLARTGHNQSEAPVCHELVALDSSLGRKVSSGLGARVNLEGLDEEHLQTSTRLEAAKIGVEHGVSNGLEAVGVGECVTRAVVCDEPIVDHVA